MPKLVLTKDLVEKLTREQLETYFLGLNVRVAAARERGSENVRAADEADELWYNGFGNDETDWIDGCKWLASCVAEWPKD